MTITSAAFKPDEDGLSVCDATMMAKPGLAAHHIPRAGHPEDCAAGILQATLHELSLALVADATDEPELGQAHALVRGWPTSPAARKKVQQALACTHPDTTWNEVLLLD